VVERLRQTPTRLTTPKGRSTACPHNHGSARRVVKVRECRLSMILCGLHRYSISPWQSGLSETTTVIESGNLRIAPFTCARPRLPLPEPHPRLLAAQQFDPCPLKHCLPPSRTLKCGSAALEVGNAEMSLKSQRRGGLKGVTLSPPSSTGQKLNRARSPASVRYEPSNASTC
jgi:hypothetical protein